jgi:hypothetical protein
LNTRYLPMNHLRGDGHEAARENDSASLALERDISAFLSNCPHGLPPLCANERAVWHRNANNLATVLRKNQPGL